MQVIYTIPDQGHRLVVFAGEFLWGHSESFWTEADWRVWVTDEAGNTVCSLRFAAEPAEPA